MHVKNNRNKVKVGMMVLENMSMGLVEWVMDLEGWGDIVLC